MKKRNSIFTVASLALPVLCLAAISTAEAGPPRSASSTVTRTGPAGNTATRQASGSYNPTTGTFTRSATTTGPAGKQSSLNTSVQVTGNGYQRSATRTGPNGNTVTSQGQASYNSATGTVNQSRTVTGPNGQSATESRTIQTGASSTSGN